MRHPRRCPPSPWVVRVELDGHGVAGDACGVAAGGGEAAPEVSGGGEEPKGGRVDGCLVDVAVEDVRDRVRRHVGVGRAEVGAGRVSRPWLHRASVEARRPLNVRNRDRHSLAGYADHGVLGHDRDRVEADVGRRELALVGGPVVELGEHALRRPLDPAGLARVEPVSGVVALEVDLVPGEDGPYVLVEAEPRRRRVSALSDDARGDDLQPGCLQLAPAAGGRGQREGADGGGRPARRGSPPESQTRESEGPLRKQARVGKSP